MIRFLCLCLLAFNLIGCNSNKTDDVTLSGLLYYRNDASFFVPCNQKDAHVTLIDKTGSLSQIYKNTLQYFYIGEPVYTELKGRLRKEKMKLFDERPQMYTFYVDSVLIVKQRFDADADCVYCDYRGGDGEQWSFEVSEIDGCITFRSNATQTSLYFDYHEPFTQNDTLIYTAENKVTNNKIEIKINTLLERSDIMDEPSFPITFPVSVLVDSVNYNGYVSSCH